MCGASKLEHLHLDVIHVADGRLGLLLKISHAVLRHVDDLVVGLNFLLQCPHSLQEGIDVLLPHRRSWLDGVTSVGHLG